MVTRLLATLVGLALLAVPATFFFTVLVPVAEYRQGTWRDFSAALVSCATLYGGAAIGVAMAWRRNGERRLEGAGVFRAGFWGAISAIGVVIGAQAFYRGLTGRFEGLGNLWGLIPIFGAAFSAMIAGGARMAWYGLRRSNTASRPWM